MKYLVMRFKELSTNLENLILENKRTITIKNQNVSILRPNSKPSQNVDFNMNKAK
jgi:hypothetical protein